MAEELRARHAGCKGLVEVCDGLDGEDAVVSHEVDSEGAL